MNVNWSDELQALDRVGPSRDLWADALARAEQTRRHPRPADGLITALTGVRSWRRRTAVAVSVAALAFIGAASALAYGLLGPSPGFTAGLSGLESLPTVPWPASMPTDSLPQLASATGLTASEAEQRLRLVQSGLSLGDQSNITLYAFPGKNNGSGCVFLVPRVGGICLPTWMKDNPALDSIAWAAWPGDGPKTTTGPLGVFGLVADNIRAVEAKIGGTTRSIPIVDNTFYADYQSITGTDTIALIIHFDDGTSRTFHAPNPYTPDNSGPPSVYSAGHS